MLDLGIKEDFLKLIQHYDENGNAIVPTYFEKTNSKIGFTLNEEYYKRVSERLDKEKEDTI